MEKLELRKTKEIAFSQSLFHDLHIDNVVNFNVSYDPESVEA